MCLIRPGGKKAQKLSTRRQQAVAYLSRKDAPSPNRPTDPPGAITLDKKPRLCVFTSLLLRRIQAAELKGLCLRLEKVNRRKQISLFCAWVGGSGKGDYL